MKDEEYQEMIKNCSEVDLYLTIDGLGYFVWRMNHDLADGRICDNDKQRAEVDKDIQKVQKQLEETVPYCSRFGVDYELIEKENPITGRNVQVACDDYWKWYRHWDEWKKSLSDEQWDEFQSLKSKSESFDHLLPEKRWNDGPGE